MWNYPTSWWLHLYLAFFGSCGCLWLLAYSFLEIEIRVLYLWCHSIWVTFKEPGWSSRGGSFFMLLFNCGDIIRLWEFFFISYSKLTFDVFIELFLPTFHSDCHRTNDWEQLWSSTIKTGLSQWKKYCHERIRFHDLILDFQEPQSTLFCLFTFRVICIALLIFISLRRQTTLCHETNPFDSWSLGILSDVFFDIQCNQD